MGNAVQLHDAIENHLAGWNPALIVRDNEPAPTNSQTDYIVIQDLGGDSFQAITTGLLDIRANTDRHAFLLRFQVFTRANTSARRSSELVDEIINHWRYKDLGNGAYTRQAQVNRIGEQGSRYRTEVLVSGFRDQNY